MHPVSQQEPFRQSTVQSQDQVDRLKHAFKHRQPLKQSQSPDPLAFLTGTKHGASGRQQLE